MARRNVSPLSRVMLIVGSLASICAPTALAIDCARGSGVIRGSCDLCPIGTYSRGGENSVCTKCGDGTTSPLGSSSKYDCYKCKDNTAGTGGKCKRCPRGKYAPAIGGKVCKTCAKLRGTLYPENNCRNYLVCKPGMQSFFKKCQDFGTCFSNSRQCCVDRLDGVTCKEKIKISCMPGTGLDKNYICSDCPVGWYNPGNWLKCKPCPAGQTSFLGKTTCRKCATGQYSPGGAECKRCPKGSYTNKEGSRRCIKCTKRTLVRSYRLGPKICWTYLVCAPGKYQENKSCQGGIKCFNEAKQCCPEGKVDRCR